MPKEELYGLITALVVVAFIILCVWAFNDDSTPKEEPKPISTYDKVCSKPANSLTCDELKYCLEGKPR